VDVKIQKLAGAQGSVTLTARSGIVTDISDTVTIDVAHACP
jgi:hypothetical protein